MKPVEYGDKDELVDGADEPSAQRQQLVELHVVALQHGIVVGHEEELEALDEVGTLVAVFHIQHCCIVHQILVRIAVCISMSTHIA